MAVRTKVGGLVEYGLSSHYQVRTRGLLSCTAAEWVSSLLPNDPQPEPPWGPWALRLRSSVDGNISIALRVLHQKCGMRGGVAARSAGFGLKNNAYNNTCAVICKVRVAVLLV